MPRYLVHKGINYPPNKRAEPGDVVDDLPSNSVKWLKAQGIIEPVAKGAKTTERAEDVKRAFSKAKNADSDLAPEELLENALERAEDEDVKPATAVEHIVEEEK